MVHDRRAVLRRADGRTVQSILGRGEPVRYDSLERRIASKANRAVDVVNHLPARYVALVNVRERDQMALLAATMQEATGDAVEVAFVDQGSTGEEPTAVAEYCGI